MRCLALAQAALKRGWTCTFLSYGLPDTLCQRIRAAGCRFVEVERPHPDPGDLEVLLETARATRVRWVVVDGYAFDLTYQRSIRQSGARLLVVDDYGHLPAYECDILLNQNLGAETLPYKLNADAVRLFGPRYALLRPEFLPWRDQARNIPETARRVLVSLGGADPGNITAVILDGLKDLDVEVKVIAGPVNKHVEELQEKVAGFPPSPGLRRTDKVQAANPAPSALIVHPSSFIVLYDVTDMPALMAWADLAVLSASSTCWEACFMGLPMLTTVLSDNQRDVAAGLDEKGIGVSLGEGTALRPETVAEQVVALLRDPARRRRMSEAGRALVDGKGADRVRECMRY